MDVLNQFNLAARPKSELQALLLKHLGELSHTLPGSEDELRARQSIAHIRHALDNPDL